MLYQDIIQYHIMNLLLPRELCYFLITCHYYYSMSKYLFSHHLSLYFELNNNKWPIEILKDKFKYYNSLSYNHKLYYTIRNKHSILFKSLLKTGFIKNGVIILSFTFSHVLIKKILKYGTIQQLCILSSFDTINLYLSTNNCVLCIKHDNFEFLHYFLVHFNERQLLYILINILEFGKISCFKVIHSYITPIIYQKLTNKLKQRYDTWEIKYLISTV